MISAARAEAGHDDEFVRARIERLSALQSQFFTDTPLLLLLLSLLLDVVEMALRIRLDIVEFTIAASIGGGALGKPFPFVGELLPFAFVEGKRAL